MGYQEDKAELKDVFEDLRLETKRKKEYAKLPEEIVRFKTCAKCGKQHYANAFYKELNPSKPYKICSFCRERGAPESFDKMYTRMVSGAVSRGLMVTISKSDYIMLVKYPCFYCGDPNMTLGLDRLDSGLGYIAGNVVSCCSVCNRMKNAFSVEDFLNRIVRVYDRLKLAEILTFQSEITLEAVKHMQTFKKL